MGKPETMDAEFTIRDETRATSLVNKEQVEEALREHGLVCYQKGVADTLKKVKITSLEKQISSQVLDLVVSGLKMAGFLWLLVWIFG